MKATKTPAMIEILRSEKLRPVLQSLSGSDDFDFCITLHTAEAIARRRQLSELIKMARTTLAEIDERR
jgi:hypothetical protein